MLGFGFEVARVVAEQADPEACREYFGDERFRVVLVVHPPAWHVLVEGDLGAHRPDAAAHPGPRLVVAPGPGDRCRVMRDRGVSPDRDSDTGRYPAELV